MLERVLAGRRETAVAYWHLAAADVTGVENPPCVGTAALERTAAESSAPTRRPAGARRRERAADSSATGRKTRPPGATSGERSRPRTSPLWPSIGAVTEPRRVRRRNTTLSRTS